MKYKFSLKFQLSINDCLSLIQALTNWVYAVAMSQVIQLLCPDHESVTKHWSKEF